jgi:Raf kinase inhibitor-like YbhB/YbcL family protein
MGLLDKAKHMIGKAMRPIHAGDDRLLVNCDDLCQSSATSRKIEIHSDAFDDGGPIPVKYSGEGQNLSPPLKWSGVPAEAREIVLVCEDPDAPMPRPFVHWVVSGIDPSQAQLPEGIARIEHPTELANATQGENSARRTGYTGPMPPPGHGLHHYHFEIFALGQPLASTDAPDRDTLMKAMAGHVLAYGEVVGTYERE